MSAQISNSANELATIRQELNELRQTVAALRGNGYQNGNGSVPETDPITDRRGMLKKVGALAAGIAAASILRPTNARANGRAFGFGNKEGDSPSANGDALFMGQSNSPSVNAGSPATTSVFNPNSAGQGMANSLFRVDNYISNNSSLPTGFRTSILAHSDNGSSSTTGDSLCALFAESRIPDGGFSYGVYSLADNIGVYGEGGGSGCGVDGLIDSVSTVAYGVRGTSTSGLGGFFSGGRGAIGLGTTGAVANPNVTPPGGDSAGDLYRGSTNSSLWYRAGGTNPYRRVGDSTTAGALSVFAPPQRIVDTRTGSGYFDQGNHYVNDTLRIYNIMTLVAPDLPEGTRAVVARITVVGATASGVIQASPNPPVMGNDLGQGTAVVNYPSGGVIPSFGATLISALDTAGQLRVRGFMAGGGQVDVIIDIVGYYI